MKEAGFRNGTMTTTNPKPKPQRNSDFKKLKPRIGLKSNTIFNYFRKQDPEQMENKLELDRGNMGTSFKDIRTFKDIQHNHWVRITKRGEMKPGLGPRRDKEDA